MIQIRFIERLREDYVGLMQEEAKVSNSLTQVTHDMDSQTQALEAQAEEYKQAQADLLSAQEVASETQKAYQAAKESLQSLLASYKEKAQAYQTLDKDYQEAQKQMFDLMDHFKSKDARRQSLESIQKIIVISMQGLRLSFKMLKPFKELLVQLVNT